MKFVVNGQVIEGDRLVAITPKAKAKPRSEAPQVFHKGWKVAGHPPGALEKAHEFNVSEWARWNSQTPDQRIRAIKDGLRPPPMWDEQQWRLRTKKQNVRVRPFAVESAADELKAMAERGGWIDVEVIALSKGDESMVPLF